MKKLTKEDLDKMSFEDINNYRLSLITRVSHKIIPVQYLDELSIYKEIRFKDKEFEMYARWREEAKDGVDEMKTFLVKIIDRFGEEGFYQKALQCHKDAQKNKYNLY